nr:uncharacterized protein LOC109164944 [Ipomoea batatas]
MGDFEIWLVGMCVNGFSGWENPNFVIVRVAIVDAWSSVLNDREKERKPKDPIMFFSSTWTTILISVTQTVVETSNNKEEKCQWFGDHLREDYDITPHSVDLKKMKMDIIDNCLALATNKSKYGNPPANVAFLASFFVFVKLSERADRVRRLKLKRMQMSWRDASILEDSVIYTTCHIELYLGQGVPNWECSIVKGDRDMLNALRKKFMHDILVSNINTHKYSVIQCALEYDHKSFGCAS